MSMQIINGFFLPHSLKSSIPPSEKCIQPLFAPNGISIREYSHGRNWRLFLTEDCSDSRPSQGDFRYYLIDFSQLHLNEGADYVLNVEECTSEIPEGIIFSTGELAYTRGVIRIPKEQKEVSVFYLFGVCFFIDPNKDECGVLNSEERAKLRCMNRVLSF